MNARVIEPGDDEFPARLLDVPDEERIERLWVIGKDLRAMLPALAIVGSRNPTAYGLEVARGLAADLARLGGSIVSGMARGIDAAAHEGALAGYGRTIAVLGTGVDVPYPARNRRLYERIAETGAIVSEQPLGTPARKENFQPRNRIIVALSEGVLVVQANGETSGAMGTAKIAGRYGRDVLAVPGDIRSSLSSGPNALLRDGAIFITRAGDLEEKLAERLGLRQGRGPSTGDPPPGLRPDQARVLLAVGDEPAGPDQVAERAGLPPASVAAILGGLEVRGWVARTPSGSVRRVR